MLIWSMLNFGKTIVKGKYTKCANGTSKSNLETLREI